MYDIGDMVHTVGAGQESVQTSELSSGTRCNLQTPGMFTAANLTAKFYTMGTAICTLAIHQHFLPQKKTRYTADANVYTKFLGFLSPGS